MTKLAAILGFLMGIILAKIAIGYIAMAEILTLFGD